MNKPKPVPLSDLVANFANNLGNISGSIPVPVSFILTTASQLTWPPFFSSFLFVCTVIVISFLSLSSTLVLVNLIALLRIVSNT